jgi:hypothetical protein
MVICLGAHKETWRFLSPARFLFVGMPCCCTERGGTGLSGEQGEPRTLQQDSASVLDFAFRSLKHQHNPKRKPKVKPKYKPKLKLKPRHNGKNFR